MAQGLNNKEMARELDISVRTVETHRLSIRRKLNIDKPAALVKYAIDHGSFRANPHSCPRIAVAGKPAPSVTVLSGLRAWQSRLRWISRRQ
jgi:hypothetical protein